MNNLKRKLEEFFQNRYGTDQLSVAMSIVGLILVIGASSFSNPTLSTFLSLLGFVLLVLSSLRTISKNHNLRRKENDIFLSIFKKKNSSSFSYEKSDKREKKEKREAEKRQKKALKEKMKTHAMFYCPECNCRCFVPKGKGKVRITCPKCGSKFIGKT